MSAAILLLAAGVVPHPIPDSGLTLPPGFVARPFAGDSLAPDIYTMTVDDAGRILVAGRGYVRVLVDTDGDGIADRAIDLIDGLTDGPMGLLAEGDSLYVVADGGVKRYRGYNGKDKLKGPPEVLLTLKTAGEHDAHALRRGPDGWLYLMCGNMAGVRKETITSTRSPVKNPVAGTLLRISPDGKDVEVVADGFRNAYSFDFDLEGEAFTYDSDNERCVGLPWWEPCRFYHVVPGGNYGWRSPQLGQFWRKPAYFPDVVAPVCTTGRGSPTGVACYRHTLFPEAYRGGFFLADWTFGRIYFAPLKEYGSTYRSDPQVFAESSGTSGFAPTALAVHPKTGELYVSIGGRGTRGAVYRITYEKGDANTQSLPMAKRSLDYDERAVNDWLADWRALPPRPAGLEGHEATCPVPRRAPAVWWTGLAAWPKPPPALRAERRMLELLVRHRERIAWGDPLFRGVRAGCLSPDRLLRAAAGRAVVALVVPVDESSRRVRTVAALASASEDPTWALDVAVEVLNSPSATTTDLLTALRIVHLAHGDLTAEDAVGTVWEGYTLRHPVTRFRTQQLSPALGELAGRDAGADVNREVARLLAALGPPNTPTARRATLGRIDTSTSPVDDFHYLIALARTANDNLPITREDFAGLLFAFQAKVTAQKVQTDRFWPLRFEELLARLGKSWPELADGFLAHPDFGLPDHIVFIKPFEIPRDKFAAKMLSIAATNRDFDWTPAAVELIGALPRDIARPLLQQLWAQPELRDTVVRVLAADPTDEDVEKLVSVGLESQSAETVRIVALALAKVRAPVKSDLYVRAVTALRRFPDEKADVSVRAALVALLQQHSGKQIGADAKAWTAWVIAYDPFTEGKFNTISGPDAETWRKRFATIDWAKGDAERGRAVFVKAQCASCHDGGRALGPSLQGVGKRFSRDDLLTAIVQPGKDVPVRYRPLRVVTADERTYTGIVIYEATSGVILQTGVNTSVRIAGGDIVSKQVVDVSLMPVGLLNPLTDQEIADLIAYLTSLGAPKPK